MHHPLFRPAALAACLTTAVALCSAATATASTATASTAASVATPSQAGTVVAQGQARQVFLASGERLLVSPGPAGLSAVPLGAAAATGGTLETLTLGGRSYVLPDTAMPYLGHGLDPGLFDLATVAAAEAGGRLPVHLAYAGARPTLPGVTITSSGAGRAAGYLTSAGAARLGAALDRQFAADHARATYGRDGLFGHGLSIALAGTAVQARGAAPAARPHGALHTLTVDGTNLAGQPDTGDSVMVTNVDNGSLFSSPQEAIATFKDGVAKFSVPAGNYWAVGSFSTDFNISHVVVLPQFAVTANTTVQVAEKSAASQFQVTTAKPAVLRDVEFELSRAAATGPGEGIQWLDSIGAAKPAPPVYVTTTSAAPTVGGLTSITNAWLFSAPSVPGTPYEYDLAYQAHGTIPAQQYTVSQPSVATENARYFSAVTASGLEGRTPIFPVALRTHDVPSGGAFVTVTPYDLTRMPSAHVIYLAATPGLAWNQAFYPSAYWAGGAGQQSVPQSFVPGQHVSESWGAYPLHPAPDVKLIQAKGQFRPIVASATRAGDTLDLYLTAFSDSIPGQTGGGVGFQQFHAGASYTLDQNGKQIAGGTLPRFSGTFLTQATLSPSPATISFALDTSVHINLLPLSSASQTVWTWRSSRESGSTLPPGWACRDTFQVVRACDVQPLMTLGYGVTGQALNGTTSAGQQVIHVSVGHLQLAPGSAVTGLAMRVSFDGGKTWHAARITGSGGSYAAVFAAPAGAQVTMRTSAKDAAGGSITETIDHAYQVASSS